MSTVVLDTHTALRWSAAIAVRADQLRMHDDPADRFIVATAIARSASSVTKDAAIRSANFVTTIW